MLVVCNPVLVGYDGVHCVQMGDHIQFAGSAITPVWTVEDTDKVVFDGAQMLLTEATVHFLIHVECDCCRVVSVAKGCYFGYGGAFQDDGHHSNIGRGIDLCFQKGHMKSGGEGEAHVLHCVASEVDADGRRVLVKDLVEGVDRGVSGFASDWWDHGVFEVPDNLIDGNGSHSGGLKTNLQLEIIKIERHC